MARLSPDGGGTALGPRTLLAGTVLAMRQLSQALRAVEPQPRIVGVLLTDGSGTEAATDLADLTVLGGFADLETVLDDAAEPIEQVLVTLPLAMGQVITDLSARLDRLGVTWRFMPTLADQLSGRTTSRATGQLAPVAGSHPGLPFDVSQLIDRRPQPLHEDTIRAAIEGKRVMITGAGGSIGSEMARVVSRFGPSRLILVERAENALFEIDREIKRVYPKLDRAAVLHDVTRPDRTLDMAIRQGPDVIFHAAAHKHVPMMEDHPSEAVENNFYGTRSIADAADACGAERFVMISSDKAVNPSSVMGATKRLAELYIRFLNTRSSTVFSMVRFGNVLGSACSVLPIWSSQLAHGGPVTVTDERMTRYFMTIPEAAGLVLQAGALAEGGEVFLLDMGKPIRILELANRFCRMQGFEPGVDVQVQITGIRPGEKLFEELAYLGEDMLPTDHKSIAIWRTEPTDASRMQQLIRTFDMLRIRSGDQLQPWRGVSGESVISALRAALPEMVNAAAG